LKRPVGYYNTGNRKGTALIFVRVKPSFVRKNFILCEKLSNTKSIMLEANMLEANMLEAKDNLEKIEKVKC